MKSFGAGPFDYVMTSGGPLPEAAGFVVHEQWTFINRTTTPAPPARSTATTR
jgi:hypothetical protein